MCGFCGIIDFEKSVSEYSNYLEKSISILINNNSEKPNLFIYNNIAFANIKNEQKPTNQKNIITSQDKNYSLILEGYIFNSKSLKNEITKTDKNKLSDDAEILLFLLIEYGEQIIEKLNGNFVFAFFNKKTKTLIISRDHMGFKNLFYYHDDKRLIF